MNILTTLQLLEFRLKRVDFYCDLAEMFETGQKVRVFLENAVATAHKTKQSSAVLAYKTMLRRFDSGDDDSSLPSLLRGIVPNSDLTTLIAIEEGDPLKKHVGLREMAEAVKRQQAIFKQMMLSLATPVIIVPFIGYLSYILSDVVLTVEKAAPDFMRGEIFSGFNALVRTLAIYTREYGLFILGGLIGMCIAAALVIPTWIGRFRLKLDSWIGFSLYRDFQAAAFFSNLALLLEAGKRLIPALEIAGSSGSKWTRWQIRRILAYLEDTPTGYADAFSLGICSAHVEGRINTLVQILQEKERRGDYKMEFADVIIKLGKDEVERSLQRIRLSALALNSVLVTGLFIYASILGLGSMTVPGKFAEYADPSTMSLMKQKYDAEKAAKHRMGVLSAQ